jgi:type VI secretion system protein VasD
MQPSRPSINPMSLGLLDERRARVRRRAVASALLLSTGLVALGCSTPPPPPKPKVLTVDVQAAANVNPDARGRPSPVVVRVYELKSAAPFETADFVSLYEKDQTLLGAEVVVRDEFVLSPGESKSIRRDAGDSKFLAVMAAFRDLERARWRAVSPLTVGKDNAFTVRLESSMLQLTKR